MAAADRRDASQDAQQQQLLQAWGGPMFIRDRRGSKASPMLTSLLKGMAATISSTIEKSAHGDITPPSMAAFYRACGGDYDRLFLHMPPQSIAFIYARLECPHSLQPPLTAHFSPPLIPALKPAGFVVWQTIQLLLGPEEHVPFIQHALRSFDIRDPDTGRPFPKEIPAIAFPSRPDPGMVSWHDEISDRLRAGRERGAGRGPGGGGGGGLSPHANPNGGAGGAARPARAYEPSGDTSHDDHGGGSGAAATDSDEHTDAAAHFFANPLYKNKDGRPAIVRQLSKAPGKVLQSGKALAENVFQGGKMILSPNTFGGPPPQPPRRKSYSTSPGRRRSRRTSSYGSKHASEEPSFSGRRGRTPPSGPDLPHRQPSHKHPLSPPHNSTFDADRELGGDVAGSERRNVVRPRRRSHDARFEQPHSAATTPLGEYDGVRRHRSVEYRNARPLNGSGGGSRSNSSAGNGAHTPRHVRSGSRLNPNDAGVPSARTVPGQSGHSPLAVARGGMPVQYPPRVQLDSHRQDYFGPAGQSYHLHPPRPSVHHRTSSEHDDRGRRGSAPLLHTPTEPLRSDDESPFGWRDERSAARGSGAPPVRLTPTTRGEWNDVRKGVNAPGEGGPGVRFAATTVSMGGGDGDKVVGGEHSPEPDRDGSRARARSHSGAKSGTAVNGVKGRRYPNEAPWDCD